MPDIFLIEPGHASSLIRSSQCFFVIIGHHLDPVGIVHGNKEQNDIVQDVPGGRIVGNSQVIGQGYGHLAGPDLGGMDGTVDHDDGFSVCYVFFRLILRDGPRIGQFLLDDSEFFQLPVIGG